MKKIALLCATTAFVLPSYAMAQSTGTISTEEDTTVVVTGNRTRDVNGITVPDTAKAQGVLTQEFITTQSPGQSILQTVNLVPGVNFTNSDPYGSSGGNIRIRGFDGNRVSLTFDGIPLNDSGNYAIFSNQQLDPELIEQVNVNLGQTDIDSPTASAAGGTVNYRTILPTRDFMVRLTGSVGDFSYRRGHIQVHSGEWWENGPRAFIAYSNARNDLFRGPGEIYKQQFNARIYYPIGSSGDFVSISGHYNRNRNNFYRNPSVTDLRAILGAPVVPNVVANPPFPTGDNPLLLGSDYSAAQWAQIFSFNNVDGCPKTTPGAGAQNDGGGVLPNGGPATAPAIFGNTNNNVLNASSCTNGENVRINPSNTGNIRINGRFTLADNLRLTVDPSYQYVLANGGGSTTLSETNFRARGGISSANAGRDYNGDGDLLDTIRFYTPNNTNTNRLGVTASLIWDVAQNHRLRFAYTFDRAHHRQTGEWGFITNDGFPQSPFSGRNATPVLDANGFQIQQRDRTSVAMLNQIAGQYIGRFFEERLRVEIGVRAPFFKRELETFCPIEVGSGFAYCTSEPIAANLAAAVLPGGAPNLSVPVYFNQGDSITGLDPRVRALYRPFARNYKFDAILPNIGLVYNFGGGFSVFGSYAMGFSAPRTDNLYRAPNVTDLRPEKTDAFDLGFRYSRSNVQAQATAWLINYSNRIVTSFNPDLGISVDRNVGRVNSWGFDGSIAWQPIPELSLYALASYVHAELKENVQLTAFTGAVPTCNPYPTIVQTVCAQTAGRMVSETPQWQFGGRVQSNLGPFTMGAQFKWVDDRFATDTNDVRIDGYTTVDVDVRFDLGSIGLDDSYVQFNVTNLFQERYFGNISTQINNAGNPNFSTGSPRTLMLSLNLAWSAGGGN